METVEIPKDVWNPISSLVHNGLFENERSAIINIVHDLSLSKMKEYELTMQEYETKYGLVFEQLEQQLKSTDKEDFEKWDEYIEWNAYSKAYSYWNCVHKKMGQCPAPQESSEFSTSYQQGR